MERTHKTWGERICIFKNDLCEVSLLELVPKQRCSWHYHHSKYNLFYVIEGQLFIKTDWGIAQLDKGQIFTTKPLEKHEFQTASEPCKIIEIMYVQYSEEDIIRESLGGPLDESA
jgi:mannose-6-phosphate isomerase-like protein (cupin superfamily)